MHVIWRRELKISTPWCLIWKKTETMSQLTLNSIPSLDAIQRQARTKDRHVKYHALDTQHNFHLGHVSLLAQYGPDSFHAGMCIPPMQPRYAFEWHAWFYQNEYDVRAATNPSSWTACSYRTRSASSDTLRQQSSRPSLVGAKPTLASFHSGAAINYKKANLQERWRPD